MFKDFNSGRECALKEALIVALICKMINGFKVLLFAERNSNKFIYLFRNESPYVNLE